MKQTKSAITFLAAQYRAIFRHAFFKGLVSATVLTAGLATGASHAANVPKDADDKWWEITGDTTESPSYNEKNVLGSSGSAVASAGAVTNNSQTELSGGTFIIGTNQPDDNKSGINGSLQANGYGAFAFSSSNGVKLNVHDNHAVLTEGGDISGSMYGAFAKSTAGSGIASGNTVTIEEVTTLGGTEGPDVEVAGAKVIANKGAEAVNNQVSIIGPDQGEIDISKKTLVAGGIVTDSDATSSGVFTAQNNSATLTNVLFSGNTTTAGYFFGGKAYESNSLTAAANRTLNALGNELHITNSTFDNGAGGTNSGSKLFGNYASGLSTAGTVDVDSSGEEGKVSLLVDKSEFKGSGASGNLFKLYGGYAYTNKGQATSNDNVVEVKNSEFNLSGTSGFPFAQIAGSYAKSLEGSVVANNNSITVSNSDVQNGYIAGVMIGVSGSDSDLTASGNFVSVSGSGQNEKPNEISNTQIGGAYLYLSGSSNVSSTKNVITASDNKVVLSGGQSLEISDASIKGVEIDYYGSAAGSSGASIVANNNSIEIDAVVTRQDSAGHTVINAVTILNRKTGSNADEQSAVATGNTITIGETSKIDNIDINILDASNVQTLATNNNVIINGQVTNGSISAGQGKDSAITINGSYSLDNTRYDTNGGGSTQITEYALASDIINLNGNINIGNDVSVAISGYHAYGYTKSGEPLGYNSNLTTVGSGSTVANSGKILVYGHMDVKDGATLSAQNDGAQLIANGPQYAVHVDIDPDNGKFFTEDDIREDFGVITMSQQQAQNYLSANEVKIGENPAAIDKKGVIKVTQRGTMEFTDAVTLSNFEFTDTEDANAYGKFLVDNALQAGGAEPISGSIFKADSITIEHQLVKSSTAPDLLGQANAATSTGIILEAKNLTLGSSKINADQSQAITFGYATVSESLNFANVKQGTSTKTATFNLTSNINLSAYQESITTEDENTQAERDPVYNSYGDLVFYSPKAGSINGDVILTKTSATNTGILHVENGNWTAADSITMDSGSKIIIGVDSAYASSSDAEGLLTDATLTLNDSLTILSDGTTTQAQNITITGAKNSEYNFDDAAENAKDGLYYKPLAQLDLRKGLEVVGDSTNNNEVKGKATISAVSGGVLLLDGSDLSTILAQNDKTNSKGVLFSGLNSGKIIAEGEVTADFKDFSSTNTVDIKLDASSFFEATKLTLENDSNTTGAKPTDSTYLDTATAIDFNGTVRLDDLSIADRTLTVKEDSSESLVSQATIKSGNIELTKSLTAVNDTLVLGEADTSAVNLTLESGLVADEGVLNVKNLKSVSGTITVANGQWTGENTIVDLSGTTVLTIGSTTSEVYDANDDLYMPSLTAKGLTAAEGSKVAIEATGTATFDQLNLEGATGDYSAGAYTKGVVVKGHLVINGDDTLVDDEDQAIANNGVTFGKDGSIVVLNGGVLSFGAAATTGAIIDDNYSSGTTTITGKEGFGKFTVLGGDVELGLSESVFSSDALTALKKYLFTDESLDSNGVLLSGSTLNIGDATFTGLTGIKEDSDGTGYTIKWADYKQFSDVMSNNMDVTNNQLRETDVTDISSSDSVRGNVGSFTLATGNSSVDITGNTSLGYAAGNNGFFISQAGDAKAGNASVASGKVLRLINGGHIGIVTLKNGEYNITDSDLTTLRIEGGDTYIEQIKGDTTSEYVWVDIQSNTSVAKEIKNIDYVEVSNALLSAADGMSVNELMVNATAGVEASGESVINEDFSVEGGKASFEELTLNSASNNDAAVYNGGTVNVGNLNLKDANTVFNVGADEREFDQDMLDAGLTGTGYLEITGVAELNSGTLFVDPAYNEKTSLAAVAKFHSDVNETTTDLGVQDGNIVIGKNAAVGIGTNLADLRKAISAFQDGESLQADKYGSILYLNGQLDISDGAHVVLNSDASLQTLEQVEQLLTFKSDSTTMTADLALSDNSAIVMTDKVFLDQQGQKTETAIHFEKDNAKVYSKGADIVLQGSFATGETLHIFSDLGGTGDEGTGVALYGENINVYTQNGFLFGTIETGLNVGDVSLKVDEDRAFNIMSEASNPVVESLIAYGNRGLTQTEPAPEQPSTPEPSNGEADPAANPVAETEIDVSTFLDQIITTTNGAPAESAARLAIYGGAVQSVLVANNSNAELISSRMGVGAQNSALTFSDNGQGAGLWVAPLYKSQETDSLGSQGLNYGVDISMYGLALGGDYTLGNGMRFGAMFNVGSGDADGQGNTAAAGTTNDFDYWGFSVYGGYAIDALTITADLGYTVVDNTLESTTSLQDYSKLTASTDSSALTFGVTGQYKFDVNGLVVAPHAGLRYTNIDLDNYTVDGGQEDVAHYNANSMSVFSIPVGVTVSKDIVAGAWTVKPSFDLTLTANMGDDAIDGTVEWTGTKDLKTNVESEVLDTFTYGATIGVAAKTGNFSLGVGLNYTGASNTDEYGVNANVRFVF